MSPIADLAFSILFLIFLFLFLLIGVSPDIHRWIDRLLGRLGLSGPGEVEPEKSGEERVGYERFSGRPLNEYEGIVFQQLALSGRKGLTAAQLAGMLFLDRPAVERACASLKSRGLVASSGNPFTSRYRLSQKGRKRAVNEGIMPRLHDAGRKG